MGREEALALAQARDLLFMETSALQDTSRSVGGCCGSTMREISTPSLWTLWMMLTLPTASTCGRPPCPGLGARQAGMQAGRHAGMQAEGICRCCCLSKAGRACTAPGTDC